MVLGVYLTTGVRNISENSCRFAAEKHTEGEQASPSLLTVSVLKSAAHVCKQHPQNCLRPSRDKNEAAHFFDRLLCLPRFAGSVDLFGAVKTTPYRSAANIGSPDLAGISLDSPKQVPTMRGEIPPQERFEVVKRSMAGELRTLWPRTPPKN